MTTLEERFLSSYPILAGLGRADADGKPLGNARMEAIAPDQWRIICEACFGYLWNRAGLTMDSRRGECNSTGRCSCGRYDCLKIGKSWYQELDHRGYSSTNIGCR